MRSSNLKLSFPNSIVYRTLPPGPPDRFHRYQLVVSWAIAHQDNGPDARQQRTHLELGTGFMRPPAHILWRVFAAQNHKSKTAWMLYRYPTHRDGADVYHNSRSSFFLAFRLCWNNSISPRTRGLWDLINYSTSSFICTRRGWGILAK